MLGLLAYIHVITTNRLMVSLVSPKEIQSCDKSIKPHQQLDYDIQTAQN